VRVPVHHLAVGAAGVVTWRTRPGITTVQLPPQTHLWTEHGEDGIARTEHGEDGIAPTEHGEDRIAPTEHGEDRIARTGLPVAAAVAFRILD
jgi:hypothetical protein